MALQLEPPVPPPRRSVSTTCDLHPGETFTGFCAACLRERLSGLDASAAAAAAPGRRSTSAIRSLFSRPPFAAAPSCAAAAPDLRRCKSFSCGGRGGDALCGDEPQRPSCDVRGRSTLWALFHQDDRERVRDGTAFGAFPASSSAAAAALAAEVQHPPHPPPVCVPEEFMAEEIAVAEDSDEITPVVDHVNSLEVDISGGLDTESTRDVRAMKYHIDLETAQSHQPKKPPPKDLKEIAGSFWLAASVFSKKWQKLKQKLKKQESSTGSNAAKAAMPPAEKTSKPSSFLRRSRFRGEADFAVAGRRSCDTDPTRFSLDAGRMSVDDAAGVSWDEPRASWDGYLFGPGVGVAGLGRTPQRVVSRLPPILSALEDSSAGIVERSDGQIPVEDDSQPEFETDANVPGGSAQTRDYYMDSSSSRQRRSLDRASSSSARRSVDFADPKPVAVAVPVVSNGRESPLVGGGSEFYHFHHAEDLLDHHRLSTSSLVEDFSASLEAPFHITHAEKKPRHHSWRRAWSLWGLIHRRAAGRRTDVADRAFSETRVRGYNGRMQRCSSNASARSSFSSNSGGLGSSRLSCYVDAHGHVKRRRGEDCGALERNRSARYSPGHADNGMLRFYLTPMRSASCRRSPGRQLRPQSFARTMLRL